MTNKNLIKTHIILASALIPSLLVPACNREPVRASQELIETGEENSSFTVIEESEGWKELEEKWDNMKEVEVSNFGEISDKILEEKEDLQKSLDKLIDNRLITPVMAEAISYIYGENLRTILEATVELPCCYKPAYMPDWNPVGADSREQLEKKLALAEDLYKEGSMEKDIYIQVKTDIENRINLLDKADGYWKSKKEGSCENHPQEVEVILHLYDQNTGGIKEGNKSIKIDIIKAAEYIVELEK